jgi:Zn-finger nucleic acid-binding protein
MKAICILCGKEMIDGSSCDCDELWLPGGITTKRIPYERPDAVPGSCCHDCGVKLGAYHHYNCDMERCPACNGQLITCGHLDVTYEQWLEEHRTRVRAQKDCAFLETMAQLATKAFTASFTADVADDARRALGAIRAEFPNITNDLYGRFHALLDRLSLLQQVVTIEPIPEAEGGGFCARLVLSSPQTRVGDGENPQDAVRDLGKRLDEELAARNDALQGEHKLRSTLRHVQTELVVMQQAVNIAHRDATRALDGPDGTAAGHYEETD